MRKLNECEVSRSEMKARAVNTRVEFTCSLHFFVLVKYDISYYEKRKSTNARVTLSDGSPFE